MSKNGSRYTSKRLPGNIYRVVDCRDNCVEGVWNPQERTWFDVRGFLNNE